MACQHILMNLQTNFKFTLAKVTKDFISGSKITETLKYFSLTAHDVNLNLSNYIALLASISPFNWLKTYVSAFLVLS